jgi:hypothetical protein
MGNGAVENGVKVKQFFEDVGTGVMNGLNTVVDFGKKIISVPVNVGDMISSGVDVANNLLGGGSQKRDILKDPNKYDFNSNIDLFSTLIKRKATPIWKK